MHVGFPNDLHSIWHSNIEDYGKTIQGIGSILLKIQRIHLHDYVFTQFQSTNADYCYSKKFQFTTETKVK